MRTGADSSHRVLFSMTGMRFFSYRECENRLSVQPPSVPSMAIICNIRGEGDVTYSLLPAKRVRTPMCGIGLFGATARRRAALLPSTSRGWN